MRSIADAGPVVDVGEMLKVMMNDVVMRASVSDRCTQRDAYLQELDRVLDLMSGFSLTDLFPASRLSRAIAPGLSGRRGRCTGGSTPSWTP